MTTSMTRRYLVGRAAVVGGGAAIGMAAAGVGASGQATAQRETGTTIRIVDRIYSASTDETALTGEAADRVAIRNLIDAWGHYADRRMADKQAALLVEAGTVTVYDGEPAGREPLLTRNGRAELREALDGLNRFSHTTHFNGQSALSINDDRAYAETYCMAHHLFEENGQRQLQVMAIRYYDDIVREMDAWRFASRTLIIDWSETRPSNP